MAAEAHAQALDAMKCFDLETRLQAVGEGLFTGRVHAGWNIGANPNGGYLLSLAVNAMRQAVPAHPDPLSVTVHYLKPGLPDADCELRVEVMRSGRQLSTVQTRLIQAGETRLSVIAAMGDLGADMPADLSLPPPPIPSPQACADRADQIPGLMLAIMSRLDIRLNPAQAVPGAAGEATISGWIRFRDEREPDALSCLLFADAFPPSVFSLIGATGWVPTVALTVQQRRRPAPGWILGQFRTLDMRDGRVIEDGALWDSQGQLVTQARQLALVRTQGTGWKAGA